MQNACKEGEREIEIATTIIMTYILNEDTQLVIRAIGVSHTACKDEFRRNLRSHSWSVFSFFIISYVVHEMRKKKRRTILFHRFSVPGKK